MQETAVARVSDDFYPRNPSSSHPHIAACAFNGFFMSAILHVSCSITVYYIQSIVFRTDTISHNIRATLLTVQTHIG